jgi:acyl carrier protein
LGRGYLHRPALSAEMFLPNPFHGAGQRMYRTGDLGRIGADGDLEWCGRTDYEIKVRGHRVNLREIEERLDECEGIARSVVALQEHHGGGDRRLAAYLIPTTTAAAPAISAVRAYIRSMLPSYMVPSSFKVMRALPLLPNGKIDRRGLESAVSDEAKDDAREQDVVDYIEPRTRTEAALAQTWAAEFGVVRVGAHDDFFDLGGDSLVAMRLAVRLERRYGLTVKIEDMLYSSRLDDCARAIDQNEHTHRPVADEETGRS